MKKYDVAAYIWPAYTGDEMRTRIFWSDGEGEWQSVKSAKAKFQGHNWPRKPLWGYVNEADPKIMEMQIEEASSHGVNVFIYDWYWFDNRPFLENCLNDGFLKASNRNKMQFYIMWANHNATCVWNKELSSSPARDTLIWSGAVEEEKFYKMAERIVEKYFTEHNYYKIDGCPVFMIFDIAAFINSYGGVKNARRVLDAFRACVKKHGFPGLHLQIVGRNPKYTDDVGIDAAPIYDNDEVMHALEINSFSHYQFAALTDIDRDYSDVMADIEKMWETVESHYGIPYFPHVSCGWDANPRYNDFKPGIIKNNTPSEFEKALRSAKKYADAHPDRPALITVNSWNEWTEGSYLQPDDLYGYGYLDAIKKVFTE